MASAAVAEAGSGTDLPAPVSPAEQWLRSPVPVPESSPEAAEKPDSGVKESPDSPEPSDADIAARLAYEEVVLASAVKTEDSALPARAPAPRTPPKAGVAKFPYRDVRGPFPGQAASSASGGLPERIPPRPAGPPPRGSVGVLLASQMASDVARTADVPSTSAAASPTIIIGFGSGGSGEPGSEPAIPLAASEPVPAKPVPRRRGLSQGPGQPAAERPPSVSDLRRPADQSALAVLPPLGQRARRAPGQRPPGGGSSPGSASGRRRRSADLHSTWHRLPPAGLQGLRGGLAHLGDGQRLPRVDAKRSRFRSCRLGRPGDHAPPRGHDGQRWGSLRVDEGHLGLRRPAGMPGSVPRPLQVVGALPHPAGEQGLALACGQTHHPLREPAAGMSGWPGPAPGQQVWPVGQRFEPVGQSVMDACVVNC